MNYLEPLSKHKSLLVNIAFSGVLYATNFFLPILTIPYTIRIVGIQHFGLISFVTVFYTFASTVVDYGFTTTSPRTIALVRDNIRELNSVVASIFFSKIVLAALLGIVILGLIFWVRPFNTERTLFTYGFGLVIGRLLMPTWFFQGIEQMRIITFLNFVSQIFFVTLLFVFLRHSAQYNDVIAFQAIGSILAGLCGISLTVRKVGWFSWPGFRTLYERLKDSLPGFLTNVSITSYNNLNTFLLGILTDEATTGYYSAVERITNMLKQIVGAISTSVVPFLSRLTNQGYKEVFYFLRWFYGALTIFIFFVCLFTYFNAEQIILLTLKQSSWEALMTLKALCFIPVISTISNPPFILLLAYNKKKSYTTVAMSGALFNAVIGLAAIHFFALKGAIVTAILTEIFIFVSFLYVAQKLHQNTSFSNCMDSKKNHEEPSATSL